MITRRQALKLSIGSLVAALPVGTRAVAAVPADLDTEAVDVVSIRPCRMKAFLYISDHDAMTQGFGEIRVSVPDDGTPPSLEIVAPSGLRVDPPLTPADVVAFFDALMVRN